MNRVFGKKIAHVEYVDRIAIYGICFNEEGKMAVIKTPWGYFLPGGGLENLETHKECLKREFVEETGYEIALKEYIGTASLYHISKKKQYIHGIGHFYYVDLSDKLHDGIELDHEMLWMDPDRCQHLLFLEHQAWAVGEILKCKQ